MKEMKKKLCTYIFKNRKIISILFPSLIATVIGFFARLFILKVWNIEILDVISYPELGLLFLFVINFIKFGFKSKLTELLMMGSLPIRIQDLLNPESPPSIPGNENINQGSSTSTNQGGSNTNQENSTTQGSSSTINEGSAGNKFSFVDGKYVINDPSNVRGRGFINLSTGIPYPSSQPYFSNLAHAIEDWNVRHKVKKGGLWDFQEFTDQDHKLYSEFVRFTYSDPIIYRNWGISKGTINKMKKLP
jgi:hypothetical protein